MQTEQLPRLEAGEYPGGIWYYEPHTYLPYRYVLGRVGRHPLVCIGINPSTAQPGALDPTLKSVERLANANGFDSWIMFNVYPQRATDPNDMDRVPDRALCDENLRWLRAEGRVLAFSRTWEGETVIAAVNAGDAPEQLPLDGAFRDRMSGERFTDTVPLPPLTGRLLTGERCKSASGVV